MIVETSRELQSAILSQDKAVVQVALIPANKPNLHTTRNNRQQMPPTLRIKESLGSCCFVTRVYFDTANGNFRRSLRYDLQERLQGSLKTRLSWSEARIDK